VLSKALIPSSPTVLSSKVLEKKKLSEVPLEFCNIAVWTIPDGKLTFTNETSEDTDLLTPPL
jgi:hypothetical protein